MHYKTCKQAKKKAKKQAKKKAKKQAKKLPYGCGSSESWDLYPEHAALLEEREQLELELRRQVELYPEDSELAALLALTLRVSLPPQCPSLSLIHI